MKFPVSSLIIPVALGALAFSQTIKIGAPADQTSVQADSSIVVEVDRPVSPTFRFPLNEVTSKSANKISHSDRGYIHELMFTFTYLLNSSLQDSLTGSTEIALVIGLASCHNAPCLPPDEMGLGAVLYSGPYTPQIDDPRKPPRQNFTVVVPDFIAKGPAQLSVFHIALVGVRIISLI